MKYKERRNRLPFPLHNFSVESFFGYLETSQGLSSFSKDLIALKIIVWISQMGHSSNFKCYTYNFKCFWKNYIRRKKWNQRMEVVEHKHLVSNLSDRCQHRYPLWLDLFWIQSFYHWKRNFLVGRHEESDFSSAIQFFSILALHLKKIHCFLSIELTVKYFDIFP